MCTRKCTISTASHVLYFAKDIGPERTFFPCCPDRTPVLVCVPYMYIQECAIFEDGCMRPNMAMSLQNRPSNNKQIKHLTILTKLCAIQMKILTLGYSRMNMMQQNTRSSYHDSRLRHAPVFPDSSKPSVFNIGNTQVPRTIFLTNTHISLYVANSFFQRGSTQNWSSVYLDLQCKTVVYVPEVLLHRAGTG